MSAKRIVLAGLLMSIMFAGCIMVPGPGGRGVSFVPILPPLVLLGEEPYYYQDGYHYYYRNDGWAYSRSRSGPWIDLPRDHYPKEVRFKDAGPKDRGPRKDAGPNPPGHQKR